MKFETTPRKTASPDAKDPPPDSSELAVTAQPLQALLGESPQIECWTRGDLHYLSRLYVAAGSNNLEFI